MAGLEHFQLWQHAGIADRDRHGFEMRGRIDEDMRAHIHAAHIEAADVGLERDDMADAFGRWLDGRARPGFLRVVLTRHEARARPSGEVDEDVAAASPDPVHDLFVEGRIHAGPRGLGIAHVDVNDCRARLGRIDGGLRDLLGGHRHRRVAAGGVRRAGHRA